MAMVCTDDPARPGDDVVPDGASAYASAFAKSEVEQYAEFCAFLSLPELPGSSDERISSDLPVLVLSGGLDVQTPYFLAEDAIQDMPNATQVIFPNGFHGQIGNVNTCAAAIFMAYIDDPSAELDTGCVSDEVAVPFVIPEPGQNLFE